MASTVTPWGFSPLLNHLFVFDTRFIISGQHLEILLFVLRQLPDVCIVKFSTCRHVIIVHAHGRGSVCFVVCQIYHI